MCLCAPGVCVFLFVMQQTVFGSHILGCDPWEGEGLISGWSELRPYPHCCQPSALQVAGVCYQGRWGGILSLLLWWGDVGVEALCLLSAVTLNSSVPSASRWLISLTGQGLSELCFCGAVRPS